ncbi:MAG: hypothetical protein ACR2PV_03850 [Gammaproteobacteria bacterium]
MANDIPLVTLQAENIQVRADWNVVGDDANHFSVEGGTLMLLPNAPGTGHPEGNTIIAIVEVRDQFSTLNPSYEDLTVRVTLTAVIMGCGADWYRNFAKSYYSDGNIAVQYSGSIGVGDVIARRYTENGYNHIYLYTVSATYDGSSTSQTYITTSPTSLYDNLKWDFSNSPSGYTSLGVNKSEDCFAEEVEAFQINQEKIDYLNIHAPLISGFYAGKGRSVTVASAFRSDDGNQVFYVNVTLGNILNELYTPKVIIDDDKVFSIDGKYPIGNNYAYLASLTVGSDSVQKTYSHEVIVVNNCPPIYEVIAWQENGFRISASDFDKVRDYVAVNGTIYTNTTVVYIGVSLSKGVESYLLGASGLSNGVAGEDYPIKFSDHFLCGT